MVAVCNWFTNYACLVASCLWNKQRKHAPPTLHDTRDMCHETEATFACSGHDSCGCTFPSLLDNKKNEPLPGGQLSPGMEQSSQQLSKGIWQMGHSSFAVFQTQ